jgi:hypothetical protein
MSSGGVCALRPWSRRRILLAAAVAVVLAFVVGLTLGSRSAMVAKHPATVHGVAMRANNDNDLIVFEGDDGTRLQFGADHLAWQSHGLSGDGAAPCLRRAQHQVSVDVGVLRVVGPGGGSRTQAVWLRCL